MKTLLVASLLALAGASSVAVAADDDRWFVRGNVGSSNLNINDFGSSSSAAAAGVSGGYCFNPNLGLEGRYMDYGKHDNSFFGASVRVDGWGIGVVGKWDFGPNNTGFYVDARGGFLRTQTKVPAAFQGGGGTVHLTDNHSSGYIGAGAGWDFTRNFAIGVNYEYAGARAFGVHGQTGTWTGDAEIRF
ncbi:MAG TPA: outer membrane beta-barrel protein [Xanthomonadaceae bacterium]|jgi:OOP family OmpA-OmpF porin/outer membrane immunogenic protein